MAVHYLVYVSQAVKPFSADALSDLLQHSRARNDATGITGLLIYRYVDGADRGNFMQILEGSKAALDDVWDRISEDRRHHSVVVLNEGESEERMFAGWTMGFQNVETQDLAGFAGYSDLGTDDFWARIEGQGPAGALELLQSFYRPA